MKSKLLKFFVVIACVFMFIVSSGAEVIAKITQTARGTNQNFGITLIHSSPYLSGSGNLSFGYRLDNRNAYRIYAGNNDFETTIICLNKDAKFPSEDSTTGNYQSLGPANASTLNEAYNNINATKAKEILWVMNNAVLPEDSESMRNIKLSKIFGELISSTASTENPLTVADIKKYLTEDDIVFAYQCAVWQATNGSILSKVFQGNSTGNNNDWDGLDGNDRWGFRGRKGTYIRTMISYYINHFDGNENIVPSSASTAVNPAITKPTTNSYAKNGSKLFVGPFKIATSQAGKTTVDYAIDFTFKNASGTKLNVPMGSTGYLLTTSATSSTTLLQQTKESLEGKEFYFAFPLNTAVRTIDIQLTTATMKSDTTGTVWKATTGNDNQPLLSISRTETPGQNVNDTYTFSVTTTSTYDVALRKYIAAVYRKNVFGDWAVVYDGTQKGRKPTASTATGTNPFNQRDYKHQKDPVEVKVGDRVLYGIVLYNESNTTVRIKQIIDHLPPSGLNFITSSLAFTSAANTKATKSGNNIIYSNSAQQYLYELDANEQSPTIYFEFEVTSAATGKIVTNIAEITAMADGSGNPLANDIDSAPNNAKLPSTEEEWQSYTGNDNKDKLNDSNYYYKGYEDDDDFEKIKVPMSDGQYTLKIIKVDSETNAKLSGATFTATVNGANKSVTASGTAGEYNLETISITSTGTDRVVITESAAPSGYIKLTDSIPINVVKTNNNGTYGITASLVNTDSNVTLSQSGTTITVTVKNKKKPTEGKYNLQIVKVDSSDGTKKLANAKFKVTLPGKSATTLTTDSNGQVKTEDVTVSATGTDTIKIEETEAPSGYSKLIGEIEVNVTKVLDGQTYKASSVALKTANENVAVSLSGNTITVTVKDKKLDGKYNLQIIKVDSSDGTKKLSNAKFKVTLPGKTATTLTTDSNGQVKTEDVNITATGTDTIKIEETEAPSGYSKLIGEIEVNVTKTLEGQTYKASSAALKTANENVTVSLSGNTIVVTVKDKKLEGKYNFQIVKVDSADSNKKLSGAKFKITLNGTNYNLTTDNNGVAKIENVNITEIGTDTITVEETEAPNGYSKSIDSVQIDVTKVKDGEIYKASNATLKAANSNVTVAMNDNTVVVTIKNIKNRYDLALKKFITKVEGNEVTPRLQNVDTTPLKNGGHDATYTMDKSVIKVKTNDTITYTIRIFNEGQSDAYAEAIKDDIPQGLQFLPDSEINKTYRWKIEDGKLVTDYLSKDINPNKQIKAFNKTTGEIDHQDVQVEFKMTSKSANKVIKNIAEIKEDDGNDDDSKPNNDDPNEDDIDYDNIVPLPYDLALKKFITGVTTSNGDKKIIPENQQRSIEIVDVSELINRDENRADAEYKLNKTPVQVEKGDYVTYTIRIFNEGLQEGTALEIVDTVPEGLEFAQYSVNGSEYGSGSRTNYKYGWKMYDAQGKETSDSGKARSIRTTYLKDTTIPAFDSSKANEQNKGLSYADVQVEFKVVTDETKELKNIAEITDDDGDDDDSEPDNDDPDEDDIDYDVVIPGRFDLSLRKFITKIDRVAVTDRVPKVDTTKLDNGQDTTATYTHTKEPKVVVEGQIVTYTIRVYNEGTINGYAEEIKDDLPEGITFLPEHETNKEYGWKMYDSNGKETKDVSKATNIRTTYGSRASETGKLLKAYEKNTMNEPDYIDFKVAFEVTLDSVTATNKIIINTAEVSKDADEYGNDVEDIDSKPDDDKDGEDDIDKEYLVLKYFDLSLLKYVSKVIVTEDGVTKEIETGYNGTENPEPIVKVELNKKKLAKTEVKYVYSIKITNEGEIEGYAKEIKDRIPDGLAFFEEDNKNYNWKVQSEGVVTTDYLKDTLLKPGESAIVPIVLRWKNSETNLGQKINVAEISKDENPYGTPDIDSKPDNNEDGEDDQDEAIVLLSLNTGSGQTYFVIGIVVVAIMATGIYAIKKFVL